VIDELPPSQRVIDRDEELGIFRRVLAEATGPRVITVRARSGAGKSWLLQRLEEEAMKSAVAARVSLAKGAQLMSTVEELALRLSSRGTPPERFHELNDARGAADYAAFGLVEPSRSVDPNILRDHVSRAAPHWPEPYERKAQRQCLDALVDDLRALSRRRAIVLLLDQYERGKGGPIELWCEALVAALFADDADFGPLVLVLASTELPLPLLESMISERHDGVLHRIPELSRWRDEHIQQWFERERIQQDTEVAQALRALLDGGATLKTLQLAMSELRARTEQSYG
jgi:hypothetical protein